MSTLLDQDHGPRLWLVDASIYVFRAWFNQNNRLFDTKQRPIHAVRGFLYFLQRFLSEQRPEQVAFAFDTSLQHSVRKQIYPAYKANRSPAPEELKFQFQLCRDFLEALGIVQAASPLHEADDLIGTWAQQQRQAQPPLQMMILSGDKDLAQLIERDDIWWDYAQRRPLNAGGIKSSFGVWPQQIADQLALAGDKVDNIPGVPGIGGSIAAKLLRRFDNLERLLEQVEQVGNMQIHGAKRVQKLLIEHQDTVRLARQLTGIACDVPDIPQDLRRHPKDLAKLAGLCAQLGYSELQYEHWVRL